MPTAVESKEHHMMPSMSVVSRFSIRVRTKLISCRVFSSSVSGLACWLRRQFGAITVAKFFTSILVRATFSGAANTLPTQRQTLTGNVWQNPLSSQPSANSPAKTQGLLKKRHQINRKPGGK